MLTINHYEIYKLALESCIESNYEINDVYKIDDLNM